MSPNVGFFPALVSVQQHGSRQFLFIHHHHHHHHHHCHHSYTLKINIPLELESSCKDFTQNKESIFLDNVKSENWQDSWHIFITRVSLTNGIYMYIYSYIYMCVYVYVYLRHHPLLEGRHTPTVKNLRAVQETQVQSLGWEDPWRREWQPTLVFLPGESLGQRSLMGYIQYIGLQRVGRDWATNTFTKSCSFFYITNTMSGM